MSIQERDEFPSNSQLASLLGINVGQIAKYILVSIDGRATLCIVRSDRDVNFNQLCKAANGKNIEADMPVLQVTRPRILVDRGLGESITLAVSDRGETHAERISFDQFVAMLKAEAIELDLE